MTFDLTFSVDVIKFVVILSRLGAFLFAFAVFSAREIPNKYQILLLVAITAVLYPVLPATWDNSTFSQGLTLWKVTFLIISEVMLGMTISIFVLIMLEIFNFAGGLLDRDIGYSMARVFNPSGGQQVTVLASLIVQIFLMVFLITDGHHDIIRIAANSLKTIGPGEFMITAEIAEGILEASSKIFIVGIKLALPIFSVMLFTNVAMGLMARIGEDFPVLMLGFPIRIGVGLMMLSIIFPTIILVAREINDELLGWISALVGV